MAINFVGVFAAPFGETTDTNNGIEADATALPVGRDLWIDPTTGDLGLVDGDLALVADGAAVRQECTIRLRFFEGEWFLDVTQGVPWFQKVLTKSPNLGAIRSIFKDEIEKTVGVDEIKNLTLDFDRRARELAISFEASTDLGELVEVAVAFET